MSEARPSPAFERCLAEVRRQRPFAGVRTLLVACSGGGDSMALLELLVHEQPERATLIVAHVEHGVRAEAGRRDALRVAERSLQLGLALETERVGAEVGGADEASLRAARLTAFSRIADRVGADAVALGHSADDVAETVLLNAARGAGPAGLAALRSRRRVDGLRLVRPLLGIRREELREMLRERGVRWQTDATNADEGYTRNRVRSRVLPELEASVPGAVDALARLSGILAAEEDWWEQQVARERARLLSADLHAGGVALDLEGLRALHPALRARLIRAALAEVRGGLRDIDHRHFEFVNELIEEGGTACDLPGVRVRREGASLRFLPLEKRRLKAVRRGSEPGKRS